MIFPSSEKNTHDGKDLSWLSEKIEEIKSVTRGAHKRGWADSKAGNYSFEISDVNVKTDLFRGEKKISGGVGLFPELSDSAFIVSAAGSDFGKDVFEPPNEFLFVLTGKNGEVLFESFSDSRTIFPTSELESHLLVHSVLRKVNSEHKAVLHLHPPEIAALSGKYFLEPYLKSAIEKAMKNLLAVHPAEENKETAAPFVDFFPAGSKRLAEETAIVFNGFNFAAWAGHGVICSGKDLYEAFKRIEVLNRISEDILKSV